MSALVRIPRRRAMQAPSWRLHPGPLSPALRRRIGDAIDALILLLDAVDSDPDLEDCGDAEPVDEREPDDEGDPLDLGEADPAWRLA